MKPTIKKVCPAEGCNECLYVDGQDDMNLRGTAMGRHIQRRANEGCAEHAKVRVSTAAEWKSLLDSL